MRKYQQVRDNVMNALENLAAEDIRGNNHGHDEAPFRERHPL